MYSGTTFRVKSGRIIGVHQRIDRVARKQIDNFLPSCINFPNIKQILYYEGKNGPDGIKRKNPSKDEPWHFIDPNDKSDTILIDYIKNHIKNLTKALDNNNMQRAAFESAWMSHAIVDGLTPAHHYPLDKELSELRKGEKNATRDSITRKILLPGDNPVDLIRNNWKAWGAKGIMTTHFGFELGVASSISGSRLLNKNRINENDIDNLKKYGFEKIYLDSVKEVYDMKMYDRFIKKGWTGKLAKETKDCLIPICNKMVCLGWYEAIMKTKVVSENEN